MTLSSDKADVNEAFDEIAPYHGAEVSEALKRLAGHPIIGALSEFFFQQAGSHLLSEKLGQIDSVEEFQEQFIRPVLDRVLAESSDGFSVSGLDQLDWSQSYLFLSNHRDIVLDPGLFNYQLSKNNLKTTQIALGDNLLVFDWVKDIIKLNKGITVKRDLSQRQLFRATQVLSSYIYHQVSENHHSVWLAQKEGRSKDGNDFTHTGLLKMLTLSRKGDVCDHLKALNIRPICISYEFDPCDKFKARELCLRSQFGEYQKAEGEDVHSMKVGIIGKKGRIHIAVGNGIDESIENARSFDRKEQVLFLKKNIDREIIGLYHAWPSNYIACDLLEKSETYSGFYGANEKEKFQARMTKRLDDVMDEKISRVELERIFLEMYANPIKNKEKLLGSVLSS